MFCCATLLQVKVKRCILCSTCHKPRLSSQRLQCFFYFAVLSKMGLIVQHWYQVILSSHYKRSIVISSLFRFTNCHRCLKTILFLFHFRAHYQPWTTYWSKFTVFRWHFRFYAIGLCLEHLKRDFEIYPDDTIMVNLFCASWLHLYQKACVTDWRWGV